MTEESEDTLAHYGVLGMRWGYRKEEHDAHINVTDKATGKKSKVGYDSKKVTVTRNPDGTVSVRGTDKRAVSDVRKQLDRAKIHPDHEIARTTLKKPLSSISNKDLQATNQRLSLEKQYAQLRYDRSTVGKGQAHVKTTLALIGTGAATGITISKLATPKNIAIAKKGITYVSRAMANPEAYMRAVRVAKLAAKVVK